MNALFLHADSGAVVDRDGRPEAAAGVRVRGTVFALIPEYSQAKVRTSNGDQLSITRRTAGVPFEQLSDGQDVELTISADAFPRVLSVSIVA